MAGHGEAGELYTGNLISMLEVVWGEGWLSPGGPEEVARVLDGIDLKGKSVLDIGCGVGGVDFLLVEDHGAGFVTRHRCRGHRAHDARAAAPKRKTLRSPHRLS